MSRGSGYIAFISYSHSDNVDRGRKWADWLKRGIEKYRIPRDLVGDETEDGEVPSRMPEVFLDKSDLPAGGELNEKLEEALKILGDISIVILFQNVCGNWLTILIIFSEWWT